MTMEMITLLRDIDAKQDQVVDRLAKMETTYAVDAAVGKAEAQRIDARIAAIEKALAEDIKPQTDDLKRMKLLGLGFLGLAAIAGVSVVGFLAWAGDVAITAVRHWLRIN